MSPTKTNVAHRLFDRLISSASRTKRAKPAAAPQATWGDKFDGDTGAPLPKFDMRTGKQNWGA